MTQQPVWKKVGTVGDINPLDYDGGFVYVDTTGVYPPEMEYIEVQSMCDGREDGPWKVYRVVLDPPRFKTLTEKGRTTISYSSHALPASARGDTWCWYKEWYVRDLPDVAASIGSTALHLIRGLFSKDPMRRAAVYLDMALYHGWENFDNDPMTFTDRAEIEARITLKPLEV